MRGDFVKYISGIRNNFSRKEFPVFSVVEIRSWLASKHADEDYAYLLLHNLEKKGEVERITRGIYTFHKDVRVVGFAFKPFYYGLEDALYLKGLVEQGSNPVIVSPRKVRNGLRDFRGRNYLIHRIDNRHFFGFELVKYGDSWIPVSDMEKTLLDLIYFKHYVPKDSLKSILEHVNKSKLNKYLERYDKRFADRVNLIVGET